MYQKLFFLSVGNGKQFKSRKLNEKDRLFGRGYSSEIKPCWMANLTRPGRSLMPSFCIRRLR